jgi:hypothetical protein
MHIIFSHRKKQQVKDPKTLITNYQKNKKWFGNVEWTSFLKMIHTNKNLKWMNWNIFTFWSKSVVQKSNVLFVCSRLYCGALALAAPVWGMIVKRRRLQVFMLAPGRTGMLVRFCAVSFVGRGRDTQKVVVVVVVVIFFFFLWTKRRETCPQEGLWPTFIPARSFFFCYISLTSFLSLKEFSEFCQFDGEKLNGIVSSDAMAISCAQLRWRY